MTLAKVFSSEFYKVFSNTHFAEYLQTGASELVRYWAHTVLSGVRLEEEEEYVKIISGLPLNVSTSYLYF